MHLPTQIIEPATTSAIIVANQVTGQSSVRNNQSEISSPFSSLPGKDDQINFSQGKLNRNIKFWKEVIRPSEFVSNIVEFGYKIPFHTTPVPFRISNKSSSLQKSEQNLRGSNIKLLDFVSFLQKVTLNVPGVIRH